MLVSLHWDDDDDLHIEDTATEQVMTVIVFHESCGLDRRGRLKFVQEMVTRALRVPELVGEIVIDKKDVN